MLGQRDGESCLLQKSSVVAAGFEAKGFELGGGEEGGDVLVAGGGAAAVERVVGEEGHVGVDLALKRR